MKLIFRRLKAAAGICETFPRVDVRVSVYAKLKCFVGMNCCEENKKKWFRCKSQSPKAAEKREGKKLAMFLMKRDRKNEPNQSQKRKK